MSNRNNIIKLRVKIRSLAEEARIIRKEERRAKKRGWIGPGSINESLHNHRTLDVRNEARAAQLAYAYLRGKRYRQVEQYGEVSIVPAVKIRAEKIVQSYSPPGLGQYNLGDFKEWYKEPIKSTSPVEV